MLFATRPFCEEINPREKKQRKKTERPPGKPRKKAKKTSRRMKGDTPADRLGFMF